MSVYQSIRHTYKSYCSVDSVCWPYKRADWFTNMFCVCPISRAGGNTVPVTSACNRREWGGTLMWGNHSVSLSVLGVFVPRQATHARGCSIYAILELQLGCVFPSSTSYRTIGPWVAWGYELIKICTLRCLLLLWILRENNWRGALVMNAVR
jgi:hypothetical protein